MGDLVGLEKLNKNCRQDWWTAVFIFTT